MKNDVTVVAEARESRGKNEARRLRASGSIPAIVYGAGTDPVAVAVSPKEISRILHSATGHNTIFRIQINGDSAPVMLVDWQEDPIRGSLLHVDLKRIDMTHRLTVKIPVHLNGDPKGVKQQGGLLEVITREIEVECLPDEIVDRFELDVTPLMLGQNLRASDVQLSGSMKLVSPPEAVIAHVVNVRGAAAETEEAAAAPVATAEPEVIKKGKKEEEAEGGDKAKKK